MRTTDNKKAAIQKAISLTRKPYSGVLYVNANSEFNHFTVDTQKTSLSIRAVYNGHIIWNKYK